MNKKKITALCIVLISFTALGTSQVTEELWNSSNFVASGTVSGGSYIVPSSTLTVNELHMYEKGNVNVIIKNIETDSIIYSNDFGFVGENSVNVGGVTLNEGTEYLIRNTDEYIYIESRNYPIEKTNFNITGGYFSGSEDGRGVFFQKIRYSLPTPPTVNTISIDDRPINGETVSYNADIRNVNGSRGYAELTVRENNNQIANVNMTYNSTSGLWYVNDVNQAYDNNQYSYTVKAVNDDGSNSMSDTYTTSTPSFIVGQDVSGSIEDTFTINPDYNHRDGDIAYYYTKQYVYHDGEVVEEGNWNRIPDLGEGEVQQSVQVNLNRKATEVGNWSVEKKLVKANSTYDWDSDGDDVLDDSQSWEPYNFTDVGTVRYNYQVVKAMESPSPVDALESFFDDVIGGIISTITDIFSSEPTAVPQPDNPPVPQSN